MDLSELRASALAKADESGTSFTDNDVLDRFINQGCRYVYKKLAQKFQGYFIREGTTGNGGKFATVVGTAGYDLPTDTMKIVRVEWRESTATSDDDWIPLERVNILSEGLSAPYNPRRWVGQKLGYFLAGDKIYLKPIPPQSVSIRIWDIPKFTALSAESDEPAFDEDYHELAAELAALQILGKSGEGLFAERMKLFEIENSLLEETSQSRDFQPETMVMTEETDDGLYAY